jgi:hypothetical protein
MKKETTMTLNADRFEAIMTLVDAWADEFAGWDCRAEAEAEVLCILDKPYDAAQMTDDQIADCAIAAWEMAA